MPRGVGVLGAEGGSKSVHRGHRTRVCLHIELPRYRQKCGFREEIVHVVDLSVGGPEQSADLPRRLLHLAQLALQPHHRVYCGLDGVLGLIAARLGLFDSVTCRGHCGARGIYVRRRRRRRRASGGGLVGSAQQRGDLEHLPRALAVALRDARRVYVQKAVLVEERVCGVGQSTANARHGGDGVGAGAQVDLLAQKLKRDLLLGNGVLGGIAGAHVQHLGGVQLHHLARGALGRRAQFPLQHHARPGGLDFVDGVHVALDHALQVDRTSPVVEL
mmetsp:Transcript_32331/g.81376  ORF Transcript_32331/g.81376 Transcript_32331/m.81376 type:complete len:274 (-) Transcript_32331:325-1146(-)